MKYKIKRGKRVVDSSFYISILLYVILIFSILTILVFLIIALSYLDGDAIEGLPQDVCDETSSSNNIVLCFLSETKGSDVYYFIHNFIISLIVIDLLGLIILNIFYIANRFYFKTLRVEKSCGAVIFKIIDGKVYYLLLKMNYGHVSLCKGHQEKRESDEETALREIKEETNLDVKLNTDFVYRITYKPKEKSIKDVYFFLAEPLDYEAKPTDKHDNEVDSYEWVTYDDALINITYRLDRKVIKKANKYIKNHYLLK